MEQHAIGHRIRTLRKSRQLKQRELAAKVQADGGTLSASFLCKIEQGQKGMSIQVASAIARALGVSLDDIVSVEAAEQPAEAVHA